MNEQQIQTLGTKYNISTESVNKIVEREATVLKNRKLSEQLINQLLPRRVEQIVRAKKNSPTLTFEGYVIGAGRLQNFAEIMKNRAIKKIKEITEELQAVKSSDEVIKKRLVDDSFINSKGQYVYDTSFNRGKVIPENDWSRTVFVLCKEESEQEMSLKLLNLRGDCSKQYIPLNKFTSFEALIALDINKNEKKGYGGLSVLTSYSAKFVTENKTINHADLINVLTSKHDFLLATMKDLHSVDYSNYNSFFIINADVVAGQLFMNEGKSTVMKINEIINSSNAEDTVYNDVDFTGFMSEDLPITFEDGAPNCVIIAKPRQTTKKRNDSDPDISLNVYGIIPMPEFAIGEEIAEPVETEVEEEVKEEVVEEEVKESEGFDVGSNDEITL